jgi:hypothetical protein
MIFCRDNFFKNDEKKPQNKPTITKVVCTSWGVSVENLWKDEMARLFLR